MITTIETRLKLNDEQELHIDSCIQLWSKSYRKTWGMFNNKKLTEKDIYHQLSSTNFFTSVQINSLINKVKTEHAKIRELTKTQLKQKQFKITQIEAFINKESKLIERNTQTIIKEKSKKTLDYPKITKLVNSNKKKSFTLQKKKIFLNKINKSITVLQKHLDTNIFKLCFGSKKLLSQKPGNYRDNHRKTDRQKVYKNDSDWQDDWELSRNNIWLSIGKAKEFQGNAEMQYYPETETLRLRVTEQEYLIRLQQIAELNQLDVKDINDNSIIKNGTYRKQARFLEINDVKFSGKLELKLKTALKANKPITAKIIKKLTPDKAIGFYLQLSFEEVVPEINNNDLSSGKNKVVNTTVNQNQKQESQAVMMGIDLNQKGLAWCVIKNDGNKLKFHTNTKNNIKSHGFIHWDLEHKSSEQRQWIMSNAITEVLAIAQEHQITHIAIENLDFSQSISQMNSGYVNNKNLHQHKKNKQYNKMLSQFAKTQFKSLMQRKTERLGFTLYLVNPAFSSIGGYSKFGMVNKLPVDIAASMWLARQALYGKEYKREGHISFKKQFKEGIVFPYCQTQKQSKMSLLGKLKWSGVSSALGTNRTNWYKNLRDFIQPIHKPVVPEVVDILLVENEAELFQLNQNQDFS